MAFYGKFIINDEDLSPLIIPGIGAFKAFSGDTVYRNRGGCTAVPDKGPIPAGLYWIVDRPTGGLKSRAIAQAKDWWSGISGPSSHHTEWFALYRDDGVIDDHTWINGVERGQFRLHPAGGRGISLGCITLPNYADFEKIRRELLHTFTIPARHSGIRAYGTIEVVANGKTCP